LNLPLNSLTPISKLQLKCHHVITQHQVLAQHQVSVFTTLAFSS
jgi:hypothetical protein